MSLSSNPNHAALHKRAAVCLILMTALFFQASAGDGIADNSSAAILDTTSQPRDYPLMRPSVEELISWQSSQMALPMAPMDLKVASELEARSTGGTKSLLDKLSYVAAERDQGSCGNCWIWAGTGVIEVDRAVKTGQKERLSIQYMNSNYNGGKGSSWACCGGLLEYVASFYSNKKMLVPWSNTNANWKDGGRSCSDRATSVSAKTISITPHRGVGSVKAQRINTIGVGKETAISNIKNVLEQNKAVWFAFYLPSMTDWRKNFFNFWDSKTQADVWNPDFACGKRWTDGAGHAVLCVGYDDTNQNNRYWIMVNSWGTTTGRPDGLFRVSMDMNYDCRYSNMLGSINAFEWQTLSVTYPPAISRAPIGAKDSRPGQRCIFIASATDPEGGRISYEFDWGDGTSSNSHAVSSGSPASAAHVWRDMGTYEVRVRAVDEDGLFSQWSEPATLTVRSDENAAMSSNINELQSGDRFAHSFNGGSAANSIEVTSSQR